MMGTNTAPPVGVVVSSIVKRREMSMMLMVPRKQTHLATSLFDHMIGSVAMAVMIVSVIMAVMVVVSIVSVIDMSAMSVISMSIVSVMVRVMRFELAGHLLGCVAHALQQTAAMPIVLRLILPIAMVLARETELPSDLVCNPSPLAELFSDLVCNRPSPMGLVVLHSVSV